MWWRWARASRSSSCRAWRGDGGCWPRWPADWPGGSGHHLRPAGGSVPDGRLLGRGAGDHARDLADLIEQLGLERPAVFGVSFGGAIALELAVEHPHRLGALVVQGVEARFRMTLGATIARRVLERFPLPTRQRLRQPVLQPAARRPAGAGPAGRLRRRAVLGDRPERHGAADRAARVVRRLRSALADRRPDPGPGRVARRDRPAVAAARAGRGDPEARFEMLEGPATSASSPTGPRSPGTSRLSCRGQPLAPPSRLSLDQRPILEQRLEPRPTLAGPGPLEFDSDVASRCQPHGTAS